MATNKLRIEVIPPSSRLAVYQLNGSRWWFVIDDYVLTMFINGVLTTFFIPSGYRYDRATIWWQGFITKDHLGCVGPLIHDVLCTYKGNIPNVAIASESIDTAHISPWRSFTRPEADDIFYAVMLSDKVVPWRAFVAHKAVKVGSNW